MDIEISNILKRIAVLEGNSHVPYDFTELLARIARLEERWVDKCNHAEVLSGRNCGVCGKCVMRDLSGRTWTEY